MLDTAGWIRQPWLVLCASACARCHRRILTCVLLPLGCACARVCGCAPVWCLRRGVAPRHDSDPGAGFFKTQQDSPDDPEAAARRCGCHRPRCRAATRGEVFLIVAASVLLMGLGCTAVIALAHANGDLERRHTLAQVLSRLEECGGARLVRVLTHRVMLIQAENRLVVADVAASLAGIATTLGAFNSVLSGRCDSIDPEVWESAASSLTASLPPTCALEVVGTVQVAPVNRTAFETKWATTLKDKDGQPLPAGGTAYPALWVYPDPTTNPRRFRDLGADGLCPTLLAAPISLPTSRTGCVAAGFLVVVACVWALYVTARCCVRVCVSLACSQISGVEDRGRRPHMWLHLGGHVWPVFLVVGGAA